MAAVGRAVIADLEGDDDVVVGTLDAIEPGILDHAWQGMADWLRASTLSGMGEPEAALDVLATIPPAADSALQLTIEASHLVARWWLGHVDEVVAALPSLVERIRASGIARNLIVALTQSAYTYATVGLLDEAHRYLAAAQRVRATARASPCACHWPRPPSCWRTTTSTATTMLEKALAAQGSVGGPDRRTWRHGLCLPCWSRPADPWDRLPTGGPSSTPAAWPPRWSPCGRARPCPRWTCPTPSGCGRPPPPLRGAGAGPEACGRPEGGAILEALGPAGRDAVRAVAARRSRSACPACSLLAAVPAPPRHTTGIACLGPLALVRDGEVVTDPDLRRERVRALLAFLVGHRTTTRAAIVATLWPDLDERAAANNLRVTLTYLLRLLEPWRSARESAYFVRFEGGKPVEVHS
jgi:hypothetical protein